MVETELTIHLQVDRSGERLDRFLADALSDRSRSQIQHMIRDGRVLVSGSRAKASMPVEAGMVIVVQLPSVPSQQIIPQSIDLDVVFEDDSLLVINKPAGMVVHPALGHREGTLVNALLARYPDLRVGEQDRPGIVHRLDRDTSGLIVVAKTEPALRHLRQQFKSRSVVKIYLALVDGQPPAKEGIIDAPIGRDPHQRKLMAVVSDGRPARSRYRVEEFFDKYSLLSVILETGRTHQIRVHLAWLGAPVAGDRVYGRRRDRLGLGRQFLHAWRLSFDHPAGKGRIELEAPLPQELQQVLIALRQRQAGGADWSE